MAKKTAERPPRAELLRLILDLGRTYGVSKVFQDFVEVSALTVSNAVDINQKPRREARYLQVIKTYRTKEDVSKLTIMFGLMVKALDQAMNILMFGKKIKHEPVDDNLSMDVLGTVAGELAVLNKWLGQHFTPYDLSRLMGKLVVGDDMKKIIDEHGFFLKTEPCCGSGSTTIAAAHAAYDAGINFQKKMHVTAIDIDPKCVHMAYLQLSLLYIPAMVIRGNSMTMQFDEVWYTPAHCAGFWSNRLRLRDADEKNNAWWKSYNLEQRIQFLSEHGIDMQLVDSSKAPREAIEARDRMQAAAE